MGLFLRKNNLLRCRVCLTILNWIGALTVSLLLKTVSKKIEALICSMKFLSPKVTLYLYNSTIGPCIECCCNIWTGASSCYLEMLDKQRKRIYRTVGPSLAASLEPLIHPRNVASLGLFYKYYFGRRSPGSNGSTSLFLREVHSLF